MRECFKGDDASQWGNGKFDPLRRAKPLTDRHQKLRTWLCPGYLPTHKIQSWSLEGFLFPVCAKLRIKNVYSASFFRVLPTAYSPGPWTDFHAKYAKRRGSAQGCALSGFENKSLTFSPPKTAILGPTFNGTNFSAENRFTMGDAPCKLPLIVIVPHKSYIVNRQIGVADYKYVVLDDPYHPVTWHGGACALFCL